MKQSTENRKNVDQPLRVTGCHTRKKLYMFYMFAILHFPCYYILFFCNYEEFEKLLQVYKNLFQCYCNFKTSI